MDLSQGSLEAGEENAVDGLSAFIRLERDIDDLDLPPVAVILAWTREGYEDVGGER